MHRLSNPSLELSEDESIRRANFLWELLELQPVYTLVRPLNHSAISQPLKDTVLRICVLTYTYHALKVLRISTLCK